MHNINSLDTDPLDLLLLFFFLMVTKVDSQQDILQLKI